jgi:hypothetical protein
LIRRSCGYTTLLFVALSATAATVGAQNLVNRSRLDLRLGTRVTSRASTSPDGVVKTTEAGGILATIGFAHWLKEGLAVTTTATLLRASVETSTAGGAWQTDQAFSVPLLVGLRRFIPTPREISRSRPWVSAEAGPVIGLEVTSAQNRYGGGSGSRTAVGARFALGARGGVGMDVRLSELLTVSGSAGYLLIPGFLDTGGNQNNQEGLDVGITVSFLLNQKGAGEALVPEGNH